MTLVDSPLVLDRARPHRSQLAALEAQMPETGWVLGVDEHTGCVFDFAAGTACVVGNGGVLFAAAKAFEILEQLRLTLDASFQVEGGFFDKKLGSQLGFADRLGSTHCLIVGDDEMQKGEVTLRDLKSGEQTRIPFGELASRLA